LVGYSVLTSVFFSGKVIEKFITNSTNCGCDVNSLSCWTDEVTTGVNFNVSHLFQDSKRFFILVNKSL
jgi:hypothetical protein